jgi:electron transfer flavoprotein beta subunit
MTEAIKKIVVCLKPVPAAAAVKLDAKTYNMIREGQAAMLNPLDAYALEEALRLQEKTGCSLTLLSMGIRSAEALLREALALGADGAVLLSDRAFAGADTLATSYTLHKGLEKLGGCDLLLCGKQAADGDTAQVGPALAQRLGWPHLTDVSKIEQICSDSLICLRLTDDGYERTQIMLPGVITVVKEINTPRLPSIKGLKMADKARIQILDAKDIAADIKLTGSAGSATRVISTFVPRRQREVEIIAGELPRKVEQLLIKLQQKELL